eukprot:3934451-Rhodomonas_salina.1
MVLRACCAVPGTEGVLCMVPGADGGQQEVGEPSQLRGAPAHSEGCEREINAATQPFWYKL